MDVTSSMSKVHMGPNIQPVYATAPTTFRHGGLAEPLDCSPVLNLCIHRRRRSSSPEKAQMKTCADSLSLEPPSSSVCFSSPGSQGSSEYSDASFNAEVSHHAVSTTQIQSKTKLPRPFKAYPKDPLSISFGMVTAETILGQDSSSDAYNEFRRRMMTQVQSQHQGTNKNMRRNSQKNIGISEDPTYWEKRRKNNEAAKRSRDARRAKEDEIAIRCAFLEQENLRLRYEIATLRSEIERLRTMF